jgi:biopolymer transport protein ExbD
MPKRRRGRHEANVELTPLIDVVFLLLIFFMVSTTFVRETQLKIELPEANGEAQQVDPGTIEIVIDRRGEYSVSGRLLVSSDKKTLARALQEVKDPEHSSSRVVITADALASHQAVVQAMDAAGTVGLTQISITTQQPEEED